MLLRTLFTWLSNADRLGASITSLGSLLQYLTTLLENKWNYIHITSEEKEIKKIKSCCTMNVTSMCPVARETGRDSSGPSNILRFLPLVCLVTSGRSSPLSVSVSSPSILSSLVKEDLGEETGFYIVQLWEIMISISLASIINQITSSWIFWALKLCWKHLSNSWWKSCESVSCLDFRQFCPRMSV